MFFNRVSDRRRERTRSRLSLETLEGRQLLTLGAQFATPISPASAIAQFNPVNATSSNGSSVVVFADTLSPFVEQKNFQIHAQRLNSAGAKVGPEILVSTSPLAEEFPSVAIDSKGDFVVSWQATQANGNTFILAQKFNPSGNAVGGVVQVAVGTFAQTEAHVAMDANGDFVVAYTRDTNDNNPDVFAKLYNVNEQLVTTVSVATSSSPETDPSVAMTPDGRFYVAYQVETPTTNDVLVKEYSAQGALLQAETVAVGAFAPSVAVDNLGNAVVAYVQQNSSNTSIEARRVSYLGGLGPVLNIATPNGKFNDLSPSVALKPDGSGAFVVSYQVQPQTIIFVAASQPTETGMVAEVSPTNAITTLNVGSVDELTVSINPSGQYLLTYDESVANEAGEEITGRLGQLPATAPLPGPRL
jgi:hypothetical protein